jgi:hypothetical protein
MMLSAEARWFWRGEPSSAIAQWFMGTQSFGREAAGGETRIDRYLRARNQQDLGIKQRGASNVEIKGLIVRRDAVLAFTNLSAAARDLGQVVGKIPLCLPQAIAAHKQAALDAEVRMRAGGDR